MAEPISPISISSDGGIKPITKRTPESFKKQLGTLVEIGAKDHGGRTIYVKHPEEYKMDDEEIKQFSLFGKQSIEQTGINSGQAHMLLFRDKDPYYQSALMQIPNDRGELPWKTIGAVSFIDSKGEKVTIPRNELTLRKPKPPVEQKDTSASQILGPSRDAALHEDYGEDITKPVLPVEQALQPSGNQTPEEILIGYADGRQDNLEGIDDGVGPELIQKPLEQPPEPPAPPVDRDQDNVGNGEPNEPFIASHAPTVSPDVTTTPVPTPDVPPEPTPDIPPVQNPDVPPTPPELPKPDEPKETLERSNVISVVGDDRESWRRRAANIAKTAVEGSRNILKKMFSERFEEKFYQHAMKMLEAAQTPFAKESIALAQAEAKKRYDSEMKTMNIFQRGARKTWDTMKDYTFGSTTLEHYTIDALEQMRDTNPVLLKEQEAYRKEQQAMVKRLEGAYNDSDTDIRKNLGEKLLILDPTKPEHKPMVDGIKAIVKDYYTKKSDGSYMTDAELQDRLDTFYSDTIRTNTPEGQRIFADAETYASSLTIVAKEMKGRIEHVGGLEALDAELGTMEVRFGIGVMGEATERKKSSTRNVVAWLEKKGLYNIVSDAALGSAVSAVLALKTLPQMGASTLGRLWGGALGGGAVTGALAGAREFRRRQGELRRVVTQKEAGVITPDSAKQRQMYEAFDFKLRTVDELVDGMQKSIYTAGGTLKNTLTEDELRTSLANLADAKARKALSSREKNRFGLITLGAVGEQETNRTHLDQMVKQTEKDLIAYLDGHQTDAAVTSLSMGGTSTEYIKSLTAAQTSVLQEGNDVLNNLTDPTIKVALSPLSSYTPEVDKLRYTLGIFGKAENRKSKGTGSGLDAVLKDFNKQATAESARMGLKTAGIGIGVGALVNEAVMDIKYGWGSGAISGLFTHPDIQPAINLASAHAETIGSRTIMLGPNMDIDAQGNLDVMDTAGHIQHNVVTNFASHVQTDATGMHLDKAALDALHHAGLNPALTTQEVTTQSIQHTTVASSPTELPGALHVTDTAGVDHTSMWSIPDGTKLVAGADSHTFSLVGDNGTAILTGIHTDANGAITNFAEVQSHLPEGWTIADSSEAFTKTGETLIDNSTRTINVYTDFHEGGMWQWAQEHTTGTPVENQNAALNVIKNVWKSYQNVLMPDHANITFDNTIPGYENIARSVPHLPNGDIWPNAIPNNSVIELPNALFSDHNMAHLTEWSDEAIRMYNSDMLANPTWDPMTALEHIQSENQLMGLVLRIGRFGMMSQERLSADELNMLMHALSATDTPANVVTDLHSIVFTETLSNTVPITTTETILTAIPQPDSFIPIIPIELRKGLEKIETKPILPPEPPIPTPYETPYEGNYQNNASREHEAEVSDRLSNFIRTNPMLLDNEKDAAIKEIQGYVHKPELSNINPLDLEDIFGKMWSFIQTTPDFLTMERPSPDGTPDRLVNAVTPIISDENQQNKMINIVNNYMHENPPASNITEEEYIKQILAIIAAYQTAHSIISPV